MCFLTKGKASFLVVDWEISFAFLSLDFFFSAHYKNGEKHFIFTEQCENQMRKHGGSSSVLGTWLLLSVPKYSHSHKPLDTLE